MPEFWVEDWNDDLMPDVLGQNEDWKKDELPNGRLEWRASPVPSVLRVRCEVRKSETGGAVSGAARGSKDGTGTSLHVGESVGCFRQGLEGNKQPAVRFEGFFCS